MKYGPLQPRAQCHFRYRADEARTLKPEFDNAVPGNPHKLDVSPVCLKKRPAIFQRLSDLIFERAGRKGALLRVQLNFNLRLRRTFELADTYLSGHIA